MTNTERTGPGLQNARQALDRRRVYIFPTRHGLMLGAMMLIILLGSINYDNALGYLLTFLLFGLYLIAMLHTYRNLAGLAYIGAEAPCVFAGDDASFALAFDNRGQWERYAIVVNHWPPRQGRWWRKRQPGPEINVDRLRTSTIERVQLAIPTTARGWLPLQQIQLKSTYPLGILRSWAYFKDDTACLVYPRPAGDQPLPYGGQSADRAQGGQRHGDDDFAGLRAYNPSDPIHAVAWKTLARTDDLLIKRFTAGAAERVLLNWRDCAAADPEAKLSQLSRWVVDAERLGLEYALELPGVAIDMGRGDAHRHRCLSALALLEP